MTYPRITRGGNQRGQAILETSLMAPIIFLLFAGIFDVGFYSYAIICTANAARVAALYTSTDSSTVADAAGACAYVLAELEDLPNVGTTASCSAIGSAYGYKSGGSTVFQVTATSAASPDSDANSCPSTGVAPIGSQVQVTYNTIQLFPLPWLAGKLNITRSAWLRVKSC